MTIRQLKAISNSVENGGNISKAMRDAEYSPKTAKNPDKLTGSKTWERLMNKFIPDKLLAEKHKELLTIPKKVRHFKKGELESEYEELDSNAISKGLDMGYKLKGKYKPDRVEHSGEMTENQNIELDKATAKFLEEFISKRKKKI